MDRRDWVPEGIDIAQPNAARMYDYWLGGSHNFAADREIARGIQAALPDMALVMQANRAFLRRVVAFLLDAGIRQFLDLGSGIPTLGNVHEVAQKAAPEARVVYVDIDPIAVLHSQHLLAGNPDAGVIQADLRDVDRILGDPVVSEMLDFDQPVAVLMLAVLHFIPASDDPAGVVARFRDALRPGSYIAISYGTHDGQSEEASAKGRDLFSQTPTPFYGRTREQTVRLFDGLELVEPGVVWSVQWRPEHPDDVSEEPQRCAAYAGVGLKR